MGAAVLLSAISYLLGSINFPILIFKLLKKGDPRDKFSGNPGATNVYRQAGPIWAAVVLILDIGRALLLGLLSITYLNPRFAPWPGFFLILGNRFPLFHGFRGGKGVANYLGFTLLLAPWAGVVSCAVWVVAYVIIRVPFLASFFMIAVMATGTALEYLQFPLAIVGSVATALFIFLNHRENIARYLNKGDKEGSED